MSSNKAKRFSQDDALSQSQLLPSRPTPRPTSQTPASPLPTATPPKLSPAQPSSTSTSSPPAEEDPPHQDLPLSMSTSLLLSSPTLPTDARTALANLAQTLDPPTLKVAVRFHAIGSAPQLKQKVFKISASSKFGAVVGFLRKRLYGKVDEGGSAGKGADAGGGAGRGQGLFCYVNSVFAPGLDEGVGNLWRVGLLFHYSPRIMEVRRMGTW